MRRVKTMSEDYELQEKFIFFLDFAPSGFKQCSFGDLGEKNGTEIQGATSAPIPKTNA